MTDKNSESTLRTRARSLYWRGYTIADISKTLDLKYATVDSWKRRDKWDEDAVVVKVESHVDARLCVLIAKEDKTDHDFKEMDHLSRILERTARIVKFSKPEGNEKDLNPKVENRNRGRKKKEKKKNHLTPEQVDLLRADFDKTVFPYQAEWDSEKRKWRIRAILKSRQIGATWYFAREAFLDAVETGDNQIFLSASKAQANIFKVYIVQWVYEITGVELKGDPMVLSGETCEGATLYFLGTNSKTAQGYHGHVYMDEMFWIPRFKEFKKVAGAMATHKKWRQTYFSSPSTTDHEAYPFWTGEEFNKGRADDDKIEIDVSHAALKDGHLGPDGVWRQIITVHDAEERGCDLFDIDQLKLEYNEADFANLYLCQFVDSHISFFRMSDLEKCMVDSWLAWTDIDHAGGKPYSGPVWIGYDPSRFKDDASVAVIAPPQGEGGKYRLIEKIKWNNTDFETQANGIRDLCTKYNVEAMSIDKSSIGIGVFDLVTKFYPAAEGLNYSVEVKNRLVLKAQQVITRHLLEFEAGDTDVALAFLTIRKTQTSSGRQTTFQASRTHETGHADIAWAIMHALGAEAIQSTDHPEQGGGFSFEVFGDD
ncbi:terminase large subunit domain-containing protein [Kiloniella sp. b19]|uniref:terminase large subunit domain-containing protein n=1 Tax=Kiloniella sp. GXU_MW_B19 TaxID=3141326 RepID=UPI0031D9DCAB